MTSTGSTAPAGAGEDLLRRRRGETVLITGASSGIGRELARLFAGDGADLVLIARSEDTLRELARELTADYGVTAQVVPADLSRPGSADQIVETLAQQQTDVDVLVNNADVGEAVESFDGSYITGPDVGTSPDDVAVIGRRTRHVLCRPQDAGGSGDSTAPTAAGVLACIDAVRDRVFDGRPARRLTSRSKDSATSASSSLAPWHGRAPTS
jgi:NAD(P)-dependent dehydrogenase (short-subunit alcohol dehydrogenase family)